MNKYIILLLCCLLILINSIISDTTLIIPASITPHSTINENQIEIITNGQQFYDSVNGIILISCIIYSPYVQKNMIITFEHCQPNNQYVIFWHNYWPIGWTKIK